MVYWYVHNIIVRLRALFAVSCFRCPTLFRPCALPLASLKSVSILLLALICRLLALALYYNNYLIFNYVYVYVYIVFC
jgi:hypothetical protein